MAVLAASAPALASGPDDGVALRISTGPEAGEVTLRWSGGVVPYTVRRASTAAGVDAPEAVIGETSGQIWIDLPPTSPVTYYRVDAACPAVIGPEVCDGIDNDCDGTIDGPGSELSCTLPNARPTCEAGACRIASCDAGWGDCNALPEDGCEIELSADPLHCGSCDRSCAAPNAETSCVAATCQVDLCFSPWADCDLEASSGCETDISSDPNHCGGCGNLCDPANAAGVCAGGRCQIASCDAGWANCNGLADDGCETALNTLSNCGACGALCNLPNAIESCSTGTCQVASCDSAFGNCNGLTADGCETSLRTLANCGGCRRLCDLANASESCSTGVCTLTSCATGFSNCDGSSTNGCELQHSISPNTCATAELVGSHCGDVLCFAGFICSTTATFEVFAARSGVTSRWFRARASECVDCPADVAARITLTVPSGVDYDLYAYRPCGTLIASSTNGTGQTDQVFLTESESSGTDDSFDYWIEVRYFGGASCGGWGLTFEGTHC